MVGDGTYLAVGAGALVAEVLSGAGHGCYD